MRNAIFWLRTISKRLAAAGSDFSHASRKQTVQQKPVEGVLLLSVQLLQLSPSFWIPNTANPHSLEQNTREWVANAITVCLKKGLSSEKQFVGTWVFSAARRVPEPEAGRLGKYRISFVDEDR